ncbi:MAG: hypothetical protein LC110_00455 [Burkholderiales bacterium]|nr:hypothetical protein [Burkholderiales bacterium]
MKTISDRYFSFKSSMPNLPDQMAMDMAEQDDSFYTTWADFQQQHPRFRDCRLVLDDALADRQEWQKLKAEHPRFCMYHPMKTARLEEWRRRLDEEEDAAEIRELEAQKSRQDFAAAAALGLALSRSRAGKKMSLRTFENVYSGMAMAGRIAFVATLILIAAVVGFHFGQQSIFEQLPEQKRQEIVGRFDQILKSQEAK